MPGALRRFGFGPVHLRPGLTVMETRYRGPYSNGMPVIGRVTGRRLPWSIDRFCYSQDGSVRCRRARWRVGYLFVVTSQDQGGSPTATS